MADRVARLLSGQLTHIHASRASPLCCPVKELGTLSQVLQLLSSLEASSPALTLRPVHPHPCHQGQLYSAAWVRGRPVLLSGATGERWDQFSRALQLVRGGVSSTQSLDIHVVHSGCLDQGHPHVL